MRGINEVKEIGRVAGPHTWFCVKASESHSEAICPEEVIKQNMKHQEIPELEP